MTEEVKVAKKPLELYLVRLSPPCRAVWLYMLQHNIPHHLIDVDIANGEESTTDFMKKNPHQEVPVLVDPNHDDVTIFEGQAILRYLSSTYASKAGYGFLLPTQMKVESLISWANSELHRVAGFRCAYPQVFDRYRLRSETATESLIESGIQELTMFMEILDQRFLANNTFLCGDDCTVADFYIATMIMQAEWVKLELAMWPNIVDWLARLRTDPHWEEVHAAHAQFVMDCADND